MRTIDADTLKELIELQRVSCVKIGATDRAEAYANCLWKIAQAPTIGGWVNFKDRPPDEGQHVVVLHEVNGVHYQDVAHYFAERWWLDGMSNGVELNAIRWYSFPEPPEEVSKDD